MDAFTQNFIEQQPLVALMHEYMKQSSGPKPKVETVQNELANKPRYDITGERYGNTLSDDMIYMKNPRTYTEDIPDKHTPESYEYFAQPKGNAGAGAYIPTTYDLPVLNGNYTYQNEGDRPFGRKKNVTDSDKEWYVGEDVWEFLDSPGEVINYYDALRNLAQIDQLSTEGVRYEKFGQAPVSQDPRYDANYDYYTDSLVNYNRLSPAQLTQLAKMGVNREITEENDASADLMGLVNLYRRKLGLK